MGCRLYGRGKGERRVCAKTGAVYWLDVSLFCQFLIEKVEVQSMKAPMATWLKEESEIVVTKDTTKSENRGDGDEAEPVGGNVGAGVLGDVD